MRIAVVGSGISGLGAAYLLARQHSVTLFEAESRLGGHTHTHDIEIAGRRYAVDTGFIVFNPEHYPLLSALFEELGVASQPTTMSFSVHDERTGLQYNATDLNRLFCQRRNLVNPRFLRMVWDIARFYREAPRLLREDGIGPSLGSYLRSERYGSAFIEQHIVPMASALWSSPSARILDFPVRSLVQFMANHSMLELGRRKPWRVVKGGSSRYVERLQAHWSVHVRLDRPVRGLTRTPDGVRIRLDDGELEFDQVVLACHSDQALALLTDATSTEREILGSIAYQENEVVLHTDTRLLPPLPAARAAWNVVIPRQPQEACTVSYSMNLLQSIDAPEQFIVTLNRSAAIDPSRILARMRYQHPVYTAATIGAQKRRAEINGQRRTWYAGAYWGFGFHEDGLRSAVSIARALGVRWQEHLPA